MIIFCFYIGNILTFFEVNTELIPIASSFCIYYLPGMFSMLQFTTITRYLYTMQLFKEVMLIELVTIPIHFISCYLFIVFYEFGFKGAALANFITMTIQWILGDLFSKYSTQVHKDSK